MSVSGKAPWTDQAFEPSKDGKGFYRQRLCEHGQEGVRRSENGKNFLWLRAALCWVRYKAGIADLRHSVGGSD